MAPSKNTMMRKPSAPTSSMIDQIPLTALQGRFPRRETHVSSFHKKKTQMLEASSLPAFTDDASEAHMIKKDSAAFMKTMDYGLGSEKPTRVPGGMRRRPVTGKVRLTRNN